MNKTIKRALTLLLSLCLILPITAVMPAQAAEGSTAQLTVEYPFYHSAMNISEGSFNNMVASDGTATDLQNTMTDLYAAGTTNITYFAYGSEEGRTERPAITNNNESAPYQGLWYKSKVNEWVAFKLKSPGAGTFSISLDYYANSNNAKVLNVYLLPGNTAADAISGAASEDTLLGTFNNRKGSSDTDKNKTVDIDSAEFEADKEYVIVFKAITPGSGTNAFMQIKGLTMTQIVANVDALVTAIGNATSGTTFTLQENVTVDALTLKSGVTLDLNGKTLTADVNATQGTVTDATDGEGSIVGDSAVVKTGANEVAIKSGNIYKIFDYTMTVEEAAEEKDNGSVNFWFKVDLSDAALDLIDDGTTDFAVGATMQWTADGASSSKDVALAEAEVTKWAGLMQEEEYWFYLNVTGFDTLGDVTGTLTVTPTISGNAGTPINYTVN